MFAAAVVLGLTACNDLTRPEGPRLPGGPVFQITDAVHNGGAAHFYLLPPLVAEPSTAGTFDGSLQPSVEVCELVSGACGPVIAHFSRQGGTGAELVKVDAGNARYFVNWNTQRCRSGPCTLDPAKFYRVQIAKP